MSQIIRQWNGRTIRQREDGYLSATDMCQACGKLFGHWKELKSTKEYLEALRGKHYADSHNAKLIDSRSGGTPETTGTWVHRKVALRLAQWLSPDFAVQVDDWVEELLVKGRVSINEEPKTLVLPPADVRVKNLTESLIYLGIEVDNPRYAQGLKDLTLNILGLENQLKPAEPTEQWCGVSERALELGYNTQIINQKRSSLGKHVAKAELTRRKEKRFVNGTMREVNLYLVCDKLDNEIHDFMINH